MDVLGSRGAGRADKTFSKKDDKSEDCCGGVWGERLDGGGLGVSIHFSTLSPFFPEMLSFVRGTVGNLRQRHTTGETARYEAVGAS